MPKRDQIMAFIRGEQLPPEVVAEIEQSLDDPGSEVRRVAREFAELTRLAFDPDGPWFGGPRHEEGGDLGTTVGKRGE